jgi:transcriptional regulator with XRE-family HTH domain
MRVVNMSTRSVKMCTVQRIELLSNQTYTLQMFLADEIKKRNISMRKFAEMLDVAPSTLSRLMDMDDPAHPKLETLVKLSTITSTSLETLTALAYPDLADTTKMSPTARVVGQNFEKLPKHLQEAILAIIRGSELS